MGLFFFVFVFLEVIRKDNYELPHVLHFTFDKVSLEPLGFVVRGARASSQW